MFITFEGGEGSGKTTQAKKLVDFLRKKGLTVLYTREPGGTEISEKIRTILLDKANVIMDAKTEVLLYMASRAQLTAEIIRPALKRNEIVICDRYRDSSVVYQGIARNLGVENINFLNDFATDELEPDITFYLDVKPEIGIARIEKRYLSKNSAKDRMENEALNFHRKLRDGYLNLVKNNKRIIKIDGEKKISEIWQEIKNIIEKRLRLL